PRLSFGTTIRSGPCVPDSGPPSTVSATMISLPETAGSSASIAAAGVDGACAPVEAPSSRAPIRACPNRTRTVCTLSILCRHRHGAIARLEDVAHDLGDADAVRHLREQERAVATHLPR